MAQQTFAQFLRRPIGDIIEDERFDEAQRASLHQIATDFARVLTSKKQARTKATITTIKRGG